MGLAQARADMERFSQKEFSAEISFSTPSDVTPEVTADVKGFNSLHSLAINPETGLPVNSLNAHVSVHEQVLIDAGYTTRNDRGQVSLKNHRVTLSYASGTSQTFLINQVWPNDTTGLIVCNLGKLIEGNPTNPVVG